MTTSTHPHTTAHLLPGEAPPRHQSLARTLASEIEEGRYPVGTKLPREMDLCTQFGASRHTVRAALDRLVRAGLIKRTPRLGTEVISTKARRGYQLNVGQISDLTQFSTTTQMEVLERRVRTVEGDVTDALATYIGQEWLFVRGLRHSKDYDTPISYHEVWVHPDYRSITGVQGRIKQSIFDLIEQQFGVAATRVRQNIRSAMPTPEVEALLQIEANTPCLWVQREYYDQHSRLVELSLSVHPGDLFSYEMELERSTPAAGFT